MSSLGQPNNFVGYITNTGVEFNASMSSDGKIGPPGPQGEAGYTPVKGTDYFTEADVSEIESTVTTNVTNAITPLIPTGDTIKTINSGDTVLIQSLEDGTYYVPAGTTLSYYTPSSSPFTLSYPGYLIKTTSSDDSANVFLWEATNSYGKLSVGNCKGSSKSIHEFSFSIEGAGTGKIEQTGNKVTSINSASTDSQYPTAKLLYDQLAAKQDVLTAGSNITISEGTISATVPTKTSDLNNDSGFGTYTKPNDGIPSTDMANAVQTSLGKADTALQSGDISTSITSSSTDAQVASAQSVYNYAAPKSHSTKNTTYGVGTSSNYGHCKVIDDLLTSSASNGVALNAHQGYVLDQNKADKTAFTGTDGVSAGTIGLVPAPTTSDTDKYLKSDGSWATVSGGGGTSDYTDLTNKPSINSVTLSGNKTSSDLGIPEITASTTDLTPGTSPLTAGTFYFVYE